MHALSHCATVVCDAEPTTAFAFLADTSRLGSWALGCWDAKPVSEGVVCGISLFDGSRTYVRADADTDRMSVDFALGSDPHELVHRISARVVPAAALGYPEGSCIVTLLAWRAADMLDDRWGRLVASHEAEILLLQARLQESS